jgi:hypothetical protein
MKTIEMNSKWMGVLVAGSIAITSYAVMASAGTKDGGGGPSIICNGPDGKVATAQLLDLYEAQVRFGLTVPTSSDAAAKQLQAAFAKLENYNWYLASDVEDALATAESKVTFLPAGVIMAPGVDLGDSYAAVIPDGCQLAYAGYYEADGTLRISQDIWSKLDQTSRAALFMHEALYKVARDIGHQDNSLVSRELNGYLFSGANPFMANIPVDDLTWKSTLPGVVPPHVDYAKVSGSQSEWTVEITAVDGSKPLEMADEVWIACEDANSNQTILQNEVEIGNSWGTDYHNDGLVNGCESFEVRFSGYESVYFKVKYGDQVVAQGSAYNAGGFSSFYERVPVYFSRTLASPTNLPQ